MFIHIGNGNVIRTSTIISIIDRQIISSSITMEEWIINNEKNLKGSKTKAKSIVITEDFIYYSPLSVPTLKKRASMISTISKLADYSDDLDLE
ncbi:DUF370 domain-containing protein [Ornithinibacillus gellani]|uniref:extracellular matrix regulator RemB n=1 Tax=Ornithinibacillus gellani TaxID=2293253 RepID=UPI000F48CEBA|nr:extracellular matrix/biofilm biosynthesis regulator RemA family protein [Ornithinibacillus gellani]TQS76357.1 DUF370 domain-containing protein [Ornithinibacillus gellani]